MDQAKVLAGDYGTVASTIPVVTSTIPAFNAVAITKDRVSFIALNLPLIMGLGPANNALFNLIDSLGELPPILPEWLWPRRHKKRIQELRQQHNRIMLWLNNPTTELPFSFAEKSLQAEHPMVHIQVLFILLHELAHFKAGHIQVAETGNAEECNPVYGLPSTHRQELEADDIAMTWLMGLKKGFVMNGVAVPAEVAEDLIGHAITFLFYCFAILEALGSIGTRGLSETHPPAFMRWALLCTSLPEHQQKSLGRLISHVGRLT